MYLSATLEPVTWYPSIDYVSQNVSFDAQNSGRELLMECCREQKLFVESRKALMKRFTRTQAYKILYHKEYSVTATVYDIHHRVNSTTASHIVPSQHPVNSTMQQHNMYGGCAGLPVAAAQMVLAMCRSLS